MPMVIHVLQECTSQTLISSKQMLVKVHVYMHMVSFNVHCISTCSKVKMKSTGIFVLQNVYTLHAQILIIFGMGGNVACKGVCPSLHYYNNLLLIR